MIMDKFYIAGREWNVIFDNKLLNFSRNYGEISYTEGIIRMANESHGENRDKDGIEITYIHEIIHVIFDSLGYRELSSNEINVQSIAILLHQFIKQTILFTQKNR